MDRGKRNEEIRKSIQIVILLCYSLYSIALAIVSTRIDRRLDITVIIGILFLGIYCLLLF